MACLFSANHFISTYCFLCCVDLHGFSLATLSLVTLHYYRQLSSSTSFVAGVVQSLNHVSLQPQELLHAKLPFPPLSPRVCSNSCPLSQWCYPTISSSVVRPLLLLPSIFPSIRVFSNESALAIRWPMYWNFSFCISPSNEYSGLIFFRMDWFDLLAVQGTLKSLFQHHN